LKSNRRIRIIAVGLIAAAFLPGAFLLDAQQRPAPAIPAHSAVYQAITDEKNLPSAVPSRVVLIPAGDLTEGIFYFTGQPVLDHTYRPTGQKEDREVRFTLFQHRVQLEATRNYLLLPAHTVYSMYDFALKKNQVIPERELKPVVDQLGSKGAVVYRWSDLIPSGPYHIEFQVYEEFDATTQSLSRHKVTNIIIVGGPEWRDRLNALAAGYYWLTWAKFASNPTVRAKLKDMALKVLPEESVNRFLQER
jgi:hypothetical protein